MKYVEYKKGNFDVTANASAGIEAYVPNTGTNIKGINTFDLTENNYYTVYVEDVISAKECVQINFELITSAFIPNFNNWIIPDKNYQQYYKPLFIDNGNSWPSATSSSTKKKWVADTNIDGKISGDSYYRPLIRTETSLTFGGYTGQGSINGSQGQRYDVIFTNADPKYEIVFRYTINDANVSYHSSKGAGFLFDCNVTATNNSEGYIDYMLNSGYLLLYERSYIYLYKITSSVNLTTLRDNINISLSSIGSTSKLSGGIHETRLEIRQISNTQQKLVLKEKNSAGNWQELMNTTIGHNKQTENAYGVIMMHSEHACSETSAFKFNNMSIIQKDYAN